MEDFIKTFLKWFVLAFLASILVTATIIQLIS